MSIFDGALLKPGFSLIGPLSDFSFSSSPKNDFFWMCQALREARLGLGLSNPNPAVGCIYVDDKGQEYARGHTQRYGGWHAERHAWSHMQAPLEFNGTAYVTLEPCSHFGHQPPCAELLCDLPIQRVVIGSEDLNPKVSGQGIKKLYEAGKKVEVGLLRNEVRAWNLLFFAYQLRKRIGMSVLECRTHFSPNLRKAYVNPLLSQYDVILYDSACLEIQETDFPNALCFPLYEQNDSSELGSQKKAQWLNRLSTEEMSQKLGRPFQSVVIVVNSHAAMEWLEAEDIVSHCILSDGLQARLIDEKNHSSFQLINTFSMDFLRVYEKVNRELIISI